MSDIIFTNALISKSREIVSKYALGFLRVMKALHVENFHFNRDWNPITLHLDISLVAEGCPVRMKYTTYQYQICFNKDPLRPLYWFSELSFAIFT